jgi:hypothetical protein
MFFILQMGFFAEAGPVQIFVSNHVSNLLGLELLKPSNWWKKLQSFSELIIMHPTPYCIWLYRGELTMLFCSSN